MKVIVSGSTGFIGSHICDRLQSEGVDIYSLARNQRKFKDFDVKGKFVQCDFNSLKDEMLEELPESVDAIIHVAGTLFSHNPNDYYQMNVERTLDFINMLKKKYEAQRVKLIFFSSIAAAGPSASGRAKSESELENPVSHYGKSKLEAEKALIAAAPEGWEVVIIRPPMVIGPRDPAFLEVFQIIGKKICPYLGVDGHKTKISFVSVFDLVEVIHQSLNTEHDSSEPQVYYPCHPDIVEMEELNKMIQDSMGLKRVFRVFIPLSFIKSAAYCVQFLSKFVDLGSGLTVDKTREMEVSPWIFSPQKSIDRLGVNYQYNLERTIDITLKDYRERGWV
ncbi:MAG: NAD(P)-dependent oxidoreductase [Bacteriovoracaceae bacterium]|jgi:UDP-glucose 4-epimerase|nr:NAD(P)-dependent oxidoreductase [Bacteriovoracaceae bacterium]